MSNPAVVKLQKKNIGLKDVWLDDNFGESIHLHIDDFRADFTNREFEKLCSDAIDSVNSLVKIDGFDIKMFDPVFFEQILYRHLSDLTAIKYDKVKISDMWFWGKRLTKIENFRIYKALTDKKDQKYNKRMDSDLACEGAVARLEKIESSISARGYDPDLGKIVLFGNDNVIRDGQHRVCALYKLYGDIEVDVIRLYFDGYKDVNYKKDSSMIAPIIFDLNTFKAHLKKRITAPRVLRILKMARRHFYGGIANIDNCIYRYLHKSDALRQKDVLYKVREQ